MKNLKTIVEKVAIAYILASGLCLLYNLYAFFFPISTRLEADAAEHLHAAYFLSIGQRPYLDFIQNHPMLFHHFLVWVEAHFHISSIRQLAMVGRIVVFTHFMLCIAVFYLWTSKVLKYRLKAVTWVALLTASWVMLDIYNTEFHFTWDLRPDFICYGQTLLGLFLIYLWIARPSESKNRLYFFLAVVGGTLIGIGNAIVPKGLPFIAAFALTFFTIGVLKRQSFLISRQTSSFVYRFLIVGAAIILSFAAGMFLDCHLSKVPVRSWISAVFLLNSKKHIIYANTETSPITHILNFFSIPLPVAIALLVWGLWELINLNKKDRPLNGSPALLLFSVFSILVNIILPTYSNGVTWGYYFVPSLFAAAAICLILLIRLRDYYNSQLFNGPLSIQKAGVILIGIFIGIQIANTPVQSSIAVAARKASTREVSQKDLPDYVNDVILPKQFVYMGYPGQMPIRSRNWGYYFMLMRATDFWRDTYDLGLGPDPKKEWGEGFGENPPDAITYTTPDELSDLIFTVKKCQRIDISWLPDEIQKRYVLMNQRDTTLYVLQNHVTYLESRGWYKTK